jgi:hypothetical protein
MFAFLSIGAPEGACLVADKRVNRLSEWLKTAGETSARPTNDNLRPAQRAPSYEATFQIFLHATVKLVIFS